MKVADRQLRGDIIGAGSVTAHPGKAQRSYGVSSFKAGTINLKT